jgi:hypothetical protein
LQQCFLFSAEHGFLFHTLYSHKVSLLPDASISFWR